MTAQDPKPEVEAAGDRCAFPRPIGSRAIFGGSRGSAPTIVPHLETAGGSPASGCAAGLGAADWLRLAAAPTFMIMALLTGVPGDVPRDAIYSVARHALPLNGMVLMYLLMGVFHSAPWLKLIPSHRTGVSRS